MNGDTSELSGGAMDKYEQTIRKRMEARNEIYESLITYMTTRQHRKGLSDNDRRNILRMMKAYRWDDTEEILYHKDGDSRRQVVRTIGEVAAILRLYHTELYPLHLGSRATHDYIRKYYYWKGMVRDIRHYIHRCQDCLGDDSPTKPQADQLQPLKDPESLELLGILASPGPPVTSESSILPTQLRCEAELSLVDKVCVTPALWDTRHSDYYNKQLKKELYTKIAEELQAAFPNMEGIDGDVVKAQFKIMTIFWQEIVRIKHFKASSSKDYAPKWKLFEPLNFLADAASPELGKPFENLPGLITPRPSRLYRNRPGTVIPAHSGSQKQLPGTAVSHSESQKNRSGFVTCGQNTLKRRKTSVKEECSSYEHPIILHSYKLASDDEMVPEADDEVVLDGETVPEAAPEPASFDRLFMYASPAQTGEACSSEVRNSPATTTFKTSPHKRRKLVEQKPSTGTLTYLKSCASESAEKDVPYACGIIVQNTFRQYPEEQHVELLSRLSTFLARLEREVKNKNKE